MRVRTKGVIGLTLLAAVAAIFATWHLNREQVVDYPNGLQIRWMGITTGTNGFEYGSPGERFLNTLKLIPAKGLTFGGLKFQRPRQLTPFDNDAAVTAWIHVRLPVGGPLYDFGYYWTGARVIAENGTRKIENAAPRPYVTSRDEVVLAIPLRAFPRDSAKVHLRILPPPGNSNDPPWKTNRVEERWTDFQFRNPDFREHARWPRQEAPVTNQVQDISVVLTSAAVGLESWVRFQLSEPGWYLAECRVRDDEGNLSLWNGTMQPGTNQAAVRFNFPLETNRVWKVEPVFVRLKEYPGSRPQEFRTGDLRTVELRAAAPEVEMIDEQQTKYLCHFDGREIRVRRESGDDRPHLFIKSAVEAGKAVSFEGGYWSGRTFGPKVQIWSTTAKATNVTVTFVCPKVVRMEFYVVGR